MLSIIIITYSRYFVSIFFFLQKIPRTVDNRFSRACLYYFLFHKRDSWLVKYFKSLAHGYGQSDMCHDYLKLSNPLFNSDYVWLLWIYHWKFIYLKQIDECSRHDHKPFKRNQNNVRMHWCSVSTMCIFQIHSIFHGVSLCMKWIYVDLLSRIHIYQYIYIFIWVGLV